MGHYLDAKFAAFYKTLPKPPVWIWGLLLVLALYWYDWQLLLGDQRKGLLFVSGAYFLGVLLAERGKQRRKTA